MTTHVSAHVETRPRGRDAHLVRPHRLVAGDEDRVALPWVHEYAGGGDGFDFVSVNLDDAQGVAVEGEEKGCGCAVADEAEADLVVRLDVGCEEGACAADGVGFTFVGVGTAGDGGAVGDVVAVDDDVVGRRFGAGHHAAPGRSCAQV